MRPLRTMTGTTQQAQTEQFRDLHADPEILILPCAWDAASARLLEAVGFPAIGTSSGAIAHSLGYPDGEHVSVDAMLGAVERITRAVSVPVSADFEAGYGTTVEAVTANVRRAIEAGAVGINIEDGTGPDADPLVPLDRHVELIRSIRSLAETFEEPFLINARTDVFLYEGADSADAIKRAIERANAYWRAGADCLFPIGVTDPPVVADLAAAIDGPINVLAFGPDAPGPSRLERLGVARVSTGAGPMHTSMASLRQFGEAVLATGEFPALTGERVSRWDFQQWFESLPE